MKLRFKLGFNTLPFWIDYFSMKWDETQTDRHFNRLFSINNPK